MVQGMEQLKDGIPLIFGLFKALFNPFLFNMDSKWLNKLEGVKYWEDLVRFDGCQNPISLC